MKKFDSINVIPFIDIMLVLLAIVLTTATFISQGLIKVALPEAKSGQELSKTDQKKVEIAISQNGEFFFNKEPVEFLTLLIRLDDLKREDMIIIRSDEKAEYRYFVKLLDELKLRKLENMAIEVREKQSD